MGFLYGLGSTKTSKIGSRNREISIDFGLFFALFADPTNTWQPTIGTLFNF